MDCEALLNDGTAFTLFLLLKGFTEGQELTAADTVRYTSLLCFCSSMQGLMLGPIAVYTPPYLLLFTHE